MSAPREGLPPNTRLECFDSRVVSLHWDCANLPGFYYVAWGSVDRWGDNPYHSGTKAPFGNTVGHLDTDDPDEAQAAFERGAEYVRTGVTR